MFSPAPLIARFPVIPRRNCTVALTQAPSRQQFKVSTKNELPASIWYRPFSKKPRRECPSVKAAKRKRNLHQAAKFKRIISALDQRFAKTNLVSWLDFVVLWKKFHGFVPVSEICRIDELEHWTTPQLVIDALHSTGANDKYRVIYSKGLFQKVEEDEVVARAAAKKLAKLKKTKLKEKKRERRRRVREQRIQYEKECSAIVEETRTKYKTERDKRVLTKRLELRPNYLEGRPEDGYDDEDKEWYLDDEALCSRLFQKLEDLIEEDRFHDLWHQKHNFEHDLELYNNENEEVENDANVDCVDSVTVSNQSAARDWSENITDVQYALVEHKHRSLAQIHEAPRYEYDGENDSEFEALIEEPKKSNLPNYSYNSEIVVVEGPKRLNGLCQRIVESARNFSFQHTEQSNAKALGFDVEYATLDVDIRDNLPAMVQLASPEPNGMVILIWLDKFPQHGRQAISPLLDILSDPNLRKVGCHAVKNAENLADWWNIAKSEDPGRGFSGIYDVEKREDTKLLSRQAMVSSVLGRKLLKKGAQKRKPQHWRVKKLTNKMKKYAANNASSAIDVYLKGEGVTS